MVSQLGTRRQRVGATVKALQQNPNTGDLTDKDPLGRRGRVPSLVGGGGVLLSAQKKKKKSFSCTLFNLLSARSFEPDDAI